jgi:hypothetical protein
MPAYDRIVSRSPFEQGAFNRVVKQYQSGRFSGFLDVEVTGGSGGALFFEQGKLVGGSYSWGKGGLSLSEKDFRRFVGLADEQGGRLDAGIYSSQTAFADFDLASGF